MWTAELSICRITLDEFDKLTLAYKNVDKTESPNPIFVAILQPSTTD